MKSKTIKIKKFWLIPAGLIIIFLAGVTIINKIIDSKVEQNLQSLIQGGKVKFSSVHSNFLTSSITIYGLAITEGPEASMTTGKLEVYLSKTSLTGIKFIHLLLKKELLINEIEISNADVKTDTSLFRQGKANQFLQGRLPYKALSINNLTIRTLDVKSFLPKEETILKGKFTFHHITLEADHYQPASNGFQVESFEGKIAEANLPLPGINSWVYIKNLEMDSRRAILRLDSLSILPEDENERVISRVDKFTMRFSEVEFIKPDLGELLHYRLKSEKIRIGASEITYASKLKMPAKNNGDFLHSLTDPANWTISIASLDLMKVSLKYSDDEQQLTAKGNLTFLGIKNNNRDRTSQREIVECSSLGGSLADITYTNRSSGYLFTIGKIIMDSKNKALTVHSLIAMPRLNKFDLSRNRGFQEDWIKAVLPKVVVKNVDLPGLLKNQLLADYISVEGAAMYIFRDRRYPESGQHKLLPVDYLKKLAWQINVNTFKGINCLINYEEFPKDGLKPENVEIEKLRFSVSPFSNYTSKPGMYLKAEASLMRAGEVYSSVFMPLHSGSYNMKGAIKNLNLPALNPASENLGKFRIKSGFLDSLGFEMNFNAERATGKIVGIYHHMVIQQLKSNNGVKKLAKFRSFLLKHVIIPPNKDKSLPEGRKTGKINYTYDPHRNVSYYLLHSLLSGIKDSFTFGFLLPK